MTEISNATVILGGGFTGLFTALHLGYGHYPHPITLIDRQERFDFKPLLYEFLSGEMEADQVCPRYEGLLAGKGVTFIQGEVQSVDLKGRRVGLADGLSYPYTHLVLALGSTTGYFGVEGAAEHSLSLRTGQDAMKLDSHLRECLQQASQQTDPERRRVLLTTAVVGGGPSGVELAATLADLLPKQYAHLGGDPTEVRVVLVNHGDTLLEGDVNQKLRDTAFEALRSRRTPVHLLLGAGVRAIQPGQLLYKQNGSDGTLAAGTIAWTAGTTLTQLVRDLDIPAEHRDSKGRLKVLPTLQLPDYPEVFCGGDCAFEAQGRKPQRNRAENETHEGESKESPTGEPLPATAQVAYQQGKTIAHNLRALAAGEPLVPGQANLRGSLLKLGIGESAAEIYDRFEVKGKVGHLIRQGTYLELLPAPAHDLKVTVEWFADGLLDRILNLIT